MSRPFYPSDEYDSRDQERSTTRGAWRGVSRLFRSRDDDDDPPTPAPAARRPRPVAPTGAEAEAA